MPDSYFDTLRGFKVLVTVAPRLRRRKMMGYLVNTFVHTLQAQGKRAIIQKKLEAAVAKTGKMPDHNYPAVYYMNRSEYCANELMLIVDRRRTPRFECLAGSAVWVSLCIVKPQESSFSSTISPFSVNLLFISFSGQPQSKSSSPQTLIVVIVVIP